MDFLWFFLLPTPKKQCLFFPNHPKSWPYHLLQFEGRNIWTSDWPDSLNINPHGCRNNPSDPPWWKNLRAFWSMEISPSWPTSSFLVLKLAESLGEVSRGTTQRWWVSFPVVAGPKRRSTALPQTNTTPPKRTCQKESRPRSTFLKGLNYVEIVKVWERPGRGSLSLSKSQSFFSKLMFVFVRKTSVFSKLEVTGKNCQCTERMHKITTLCRILLII